MACKHPTKCFVIFVGELWPCKGQGKAFNEWLTIQTSTATSSIEIMINDSTTSVNVTSKSCWTSNLYGRCQGGKTGFCDLLGIHFHVKKVNLLAQYLSVGAKIIPLHRTIIVVSYSVNLINTKTSNHCNHSIIVYAAICLWYHTAQQTTPTPTLSLRLTPRLTVRLSSAHMHSDIQMCYSPNE